MSSKHRNQPRRSFVAIAAVAAAGLGAPSTAAAESRIDPYGFLRLDSIFASSELNHPEASLFVDMPPPGMSLGDQLVLHPRLSRLGLGVEQPIDAETWIDGVLEVDFQNGGSESRPIPRLRHGFARVNVHGFRLLFGQTWQTVSRLIPTANADTLMWATGNTGDRSPQLRLGYDLPVGDNDVIRFEGAAQTIGAVDAKGQRRLNFGGLPALQLRVAAVAPLWTQRPLIVALGGDVAREDLTEKPVGRTSFTRRGLFAELEVPIVDQLVVRGELFAGHDLSDLRGGVGQGINPVRDVSISTVGFWGELWSSPLPWLTLAAGYGRDDPSDADLEMRQIASNSAFWAVGQATLWKTLRVGADYIYWRTSYLPEPTITAHRVNVYLSWTLGHAPAAVAPEHKQVRAAAPVPPPPAPQ